MIHFENLTSDSMAIICISVILLCGFLMTRITKKLSLPNVTAYIVTGILLGPYAFNIIPSAFVRSTGFLPDIALSFIAFSTGEFFRIETLKKSGSKTLIITLFEALSAFVLVFVMSRFILHLDLPFSLVLSALATATAPASTMMTIRQTGARGEFVETLLQVVALDDVVALLAYSAAVAVCQAYSNSGSIEIMEIVAPIIQNIIAIIGGALFGVLLKASIHPKRTTDNRLIVSLAIIFGFCGICTIFDISPLLGCMVMSTVYINLGGDEKLFKQLNYFSPPILLIFFVRSGVNFDLDALFDNSNAIGSYSLFLIGVLYFIVRIIGKYSGTYLGCRSTGRSEKVCRYLGLALFPQAGVAIGLAALGARIIGGSSGLALNTVIMTSSILYELVGPVAAKTALQLSGSFPEADQKQIQPPASSLNEENEEAYDEAVSQLEDDLK